MGCATMVSAFWSLLGVFLTLMLFGLVVWLYLAFGRVYVGLNGNMEIGVVLIALWAVKDSLASASNAVVGVLQRVATK